MPLDHFIIQIYLFVDCYFPKENCLRTRGPRPLMSDAEVITLEIVGEYLGLGSDKGIYDYFDRHWRSWFPSLGCRTTFTRQSANLRKIKQDIHRLVVHTLQAKQGVYLFDGFPLPTCHIKRYKRSHTDLSADAGVGYCAAKQEKYFGFKAHLLTNAQGVIIDVTFAAAPLDERDVLPEIAHPYTGHLLADKGLLRPQLSQDLAAQDLILHTPLRKNMRQTRSKTFVSKIMNIRRRIETIISQLTQRFAIQSIRAKDLWHFTAKVARKILAHTLCFSINNSLKFEQIIKP